MIIGPKPQPKRPNMSTIVFIDTRGGKLPKAAQEAVTYASQLGRRTRDRRDLRRCKGLETLVRKAPAR
jgi:hypothetical protein